jgi:hypothetical protein
MLIPAIKGTSAKTRQGFHLIARCLLEMIKRGANTVTVPGSRIVNKRLLRNNGIQRFHAKISRQQILVAIS